MINKESPASIEKLRWIMSQLRDPETGCPWDIKQSFASIVPYTIEEAYEVGDAIERSAFDELPAELGDLLFQVIFYAQLAEEEKRFTFDDIITAVCEKLIRRHPHVFGESDFQSDEEVKANWEAEKAKERALKNAGEEPSILDDIPANLPALSRASKVQKRCRNVGFDWFEVMPVLEKVEEEVAELKDELQKSTPDPEKIEEELGDLMFASVNLSRHVKVDAEQTLRKATAKFERRFREVEKLALQGNIDMKEASLEQLDALWNQVKSTEKG